MTAAARVWTNGGRTRSRGDGRGGYRRSAWVAAATLLVAVAGIPEARAFDVQRDDWGQVLRFDQGPVAVFLDSHRPQGVSAGVLAKKAHAAIATLTAVQGSRLKLVEGGVVRAAPLIDIWIRFEFADFDLGRWDLSGYVVHVANDDGGLTRAEVVLNAVDFAWSSTGATAGKQLGDLQAVLTRQLAYAVGLAHSREPSATLYFFGHDASLRTLTEDDERGLAFLYPDDPDSPMVDGRPCDACTAHDQCAGGLCLLWPSGGGYCAPPCEGHSDCALGSSCGEWHDGLACMPNDGHCRAELGEAGPSRLCASDVPCGPDLFCQPSPGGGFCTRPCSFGCMGAGSCVISGMGGLCMSLGAQPVGAICLLPPDCAGGWCAPSIAGGGRCSARCDDGQACPNGTACDLSDNCVTPGTLAAGWPCRSGFDCASGLCVEQTGGPFAQVCTEPCEVAGDCPGGTGCTATSAGTLCLPHGAALIGGPCLSAGTCASGAVCDATSIAAVGSCQRRCDAFGDGAECEVGERCAWLGDGPGAGVCRGVGGGALPGAPCSATAVCRADLVCAGDSASDATCRADCDVDAGGGCAAGENCAPLTRGDGLVPWRGACGDETGALVLVEGPKAKVANPLALKIVQPDVVAIDAPAAADESDGGCAASPLLGRGASGTGGWWLGAFLALALVGGRRRRGLVPGTHAAPTGGER